MASIPMFSADVAAGELGAALQDAGCAVVHELFDHTVRRDLRPLLPPQLDLADPDAGLAVNALYEAEPDGLGYRDFYQGNTRRVISLIRKLPTFRALATHPITVAACEASLK